MSTAPSALSMGQKQLLRSLAISAASLSIIAGAFMLYWFIKLKHRTFRHQLVMLLIMSDFLKALCELIYPAATLMSGSIESGPFCTSMGYTATIFINATDFAILVIAVHTALCIFRPPRGGMGSEQAGLYRWRYYAYVSWAVYSVTLSSLAFLNKETAYVSSVSWCFLPVRPFYWRIALSWGPRYVILLFILVLYVSIFFYVRRKFKSFHRMFADSDLEESLDCSNFGNVSTANHAPLSPPQASTVAELKTHDLITPLEVAAPDYYHAGSGRMPPIDPLVRNERDSAMTSSISTGEETICDPSATPGFTPARKQSVISINLPAHFQSRRPSILTLVRNTSSYVRPDLDLMSPTSEHFNPFGRPRSIDPLRLERARIVKQLKHLFVFPIVYFLMWIIPFCYHMTQYSDRHVFSPIHSLAAIASFTIPLHGLVDVIVYARNEKPWRSWRFRSSEARLSARRSVAAPLDGHGGSGEHETKGSSANHRRREDPTDLVMQRHREEIREAEARRSQRTSRGRTSGQHSDWWDLETELVDLENQQIPDERDEEIAEKDEGQLRK